MQNFRKQIAALAIAAVIIFGGCSGGGGSLAGNPEVGSYSLKINWPGTTGANDVGDKIIPEGSQNIVIEITGEDIDQPVVTTLIYPETEMFIEDLPAGVNLAEIKAYDSSSNIMAQRREIFEIESGKTTDSGNLYLLCLRKGV